MSKALKKKTKQIICDAFFLEISFFHYSTCRRWKRRKARCRLDSTLGVDDRLIGAGDNGVATCLGARERNRVNGTSCIGDGDTGSGEPNDKMTDSSSSSSCCFSTSSSSSSTTITAGRGDCTVEPKSTGCEDIGEEQTESLVALVRCVGGNGE